MTHSEKHSSAAALARLLLLLLLLLCGAPVLTWFLHISSSGLTIT
jgi:hypothetical protein